VKRAAALLAATLIALSLGAGDGRPAQNDQMTVTMLATSTSEPGYSVLIANFERVYPNITVNVSYASAGVLNQLVVTELAAGSAPDILSTAPGCGTVNAVCKLARAGDLAPMLKVPWAKRSLPAVISQDKYGAGLFAFTPSVSLSGAFTNDALFTKLGLKVPQTFPQLLDLCQKAKADGTTAVIVNGGSPTFKFLVYNLATADLYGQDKRWTAELKAGKATFDGTAGWRTALQDVIDMNNAGCFEPGVTGTTTGEALFAQGEGLLIEDNSDAKGTIDAGDPQFPYSFVLFPGGTTSSQTRTFLTAPQSLAVNAHASTQAQSAAQTFIDFVARPKQDALYAQVTGGLTQYQFLKGQLPSFMSASFAQVVNDRAYVMNPQETWWNADVLTALTQYQLGLLTGQNSIDQILNAMDAGWKLGPS
jgi:raffinose/stachyose/melibiose transport system substrate-binding protein